MSEPTTAAGRTLVRWLTTGNNPPRSAEHIALAIEAEARAAALDEARAAVGRMRTYPFKEAPYGDKPHAMVLLDGVLAAINTLQKGEQ